jgi:predicted ATPase
MRIASLTVSNIRAIHRLELQDLADVVLIAGPNGCGKSCLFDAIRLLKSCYGGYQPNEWQQWFGEYGINLARRNSDFGYLYRDKAKPIEIEAEFQLAAGEVQYLARNVEILAERRAWDEIAPQMREFAMGPIASTNRAHERQVNERRAELVEAVRHALDRGSHRGRVEMSGQGLKTNRNELLEFVFSSYEPEHLGIIDFYGSSRMYSRESLDAVNLSIESTDQRERQSRLYNHSQKYTNIKSEMATSYIRGLLSQQLGLVTEAKTSMSESLKELFSTFFPDKRFAGPVPTSDRALSFPVRSESGIEHDINDLSSGEKEVLFGYLRLRNSSPRNSVILLDEPEMHLNPSLIRGLPQFYRKHIGEAMGNQLWLVTHSDAFLREAVGQPGIDVYHMQHASHSIAKGCVNQVARIGVDEELERAIVDLVGDLATFKPGNPVLIFEGEGAEFDVAMVMRLFPELEKTFNAVSAGNKSSARRLHRLLREASAKASLSDRFFVIVDRDCDGGEAADGVSVWPVYHIENFLLDAEFCLLALRDLTTAAGAFRDTEQVDTALKVAARETIGELVRHRLQNFANDALVGAIRIETARGQDGATAERLVQAVVASVERMKVVSEGPLSLKEVRRREEEETTRLEASLAGEEWRAEFRGRDVLRRFVSKYVKIVKYEVFRDLVIARMRDRGHRPAGMSQVISEIVARARVPRQPLAPLASSGSGDGNSSRIG